MRKRFGLAMVAVTALGAATAQADVILLSADEWCPYNCAPDGDRPGYGIEVAREALAKSGHTLEYKTMAWARALDECEKGTVTAVIGATKSDDRKLVFPAEAIGVADNSFVVKKGNPWRYAGPASLESVKLGVIQGYVYEGELGAYLDKNTKDKARVDTIGGDTALDQNLKKLVAGRVDVTTDAGPVLAYKVGQMNLADKVEMAGSIDLSQIYIAFSAANPKSKDYAQALDKGIADLRSSGRLKAILAKYGVPDWK